MTDFVARKAYDRWGSDYSEPRDKFFQTPDRNFVRHTNKTAVMVPIKDYESVNRRYQLDEHFGGPYSFAGFVAVRKVMKWAQKHKHHTRSFLRGWR